MAKKTKGTKKSKKQKPAKPLPLREFKGDVASKPRANMPRGR